MRLTFNSGDKMRVELDFYDEFGAILDTFAQTWQLHVDHSAAGEGAIVHKMGEGGSGLCAIGEL